MEKRYYWLKFKEDFFGSKRIKKLRKMAGGDTYVIIYLKMQLKALRTNGVLEFTGLEDNFADELALDIEENPEDVRIVVTYLLTYGLCECSDNVHYFLPWVKENTGSETASTQRSRDSRKRKKLQCNTTATQLQQICNATETQLQQPCNVEKEIEKEIDIDKRVSRHPTLEEVKAYCSERGNKINPEHFIDYYTANGWKVGKNPMKDWKATVRNWERSEAKTASKRNTLMNYKEQGKNHSDLSEIELDMEEL